MAHHDTLPEELEEEEEEEMPELSGHCVVYGRKAQVLAKKPATTPSRWRVMGEKNEVGGNPDPQIARRQEELERIRAAIADQQQEEHFVRRNRFRREYPNFLRGNAPRLSSFDGILSIVGSMGKYQWRSILFILIPLAFCHSFIMLDSMAHLITPDHWCAPEERRSNKSMEEIAQWKLNNLPYSVEAKTGQLKFSKCTIYAPDTVNSHACHNGWEYDTSLYARTLVTENNWVCNKEVVVTKAYAILAIGTFVGAFSFGFVADLIGRRVTCMLLASTNVFAQAVISLLYNEQGIVFSALFFKAATFTSLLHLPAIWVMEIVTSKHRAPILGLMGISNIFGVGIFSSLAYAIHDSKMIAVMGITMYTIIAIICHSMKESPRLLFHLGELTSATQILGEIGGRNEMMGKGSIVTNSYLYDTARYLHCVRTQSITSKHCEFSIFELFWRRRTLKIAVRLLFMWFSLGVVDKVMEYNIPDYAPNAFYNFFLVRLPQLPGVLLGTFLPYLLGRRDFHVIVQGIFAVLLFTTGFAQIFSVQAHRYLGIFLRMTLSASYLNCFVHTVELVSTDVRSSFCGMCVAFYYFFPSSIPHMDFMVQSQYGVPYFICTFLCFLSAIVGLFLCETLDEPLPDYLDDTERRSRQGFGSYFLKVWVPLRDETPTEDVNYNPAYEPGERVDDDIEADPADPSFVHDCLYTNERMI